MATQTVQIWANPLLGGTLILKLYAETVTDAVVATAPAVRGSADRCVYSADFEDLAAGRYRATLFSDTIEVASDHVTIAADTGIYQTDDQIGLTPQAIRDALKLAPTAGTPATGSIDAELDFVVLKAALLTSSLRVSVVSNVTAGGTICLTLGDDHLIANGNQFDIEVADVGESLKTALTAATSLRFGAGKDSNANTITGSVSGDNVTHTDGVTTISVEITAAQSAAADWRETYEYHIKAVDGSGNEATKVSGLLEVSPERAQV